MDGEIWLYLALGSIPVFLLHNVFVLLIS
ncbi:hypothetical protein ANCCAN_15921 [Ancylostoma caninum]|uniref:Uncharacterized protein n=1 Tax=Ancylostoma caninum TaxID=29170 RepID=A0A368G135_ANCCA|nr:hypothetical protein ANCCAN_15921 [Ancylostoma caninum]